MSCLSNMYVRLFRWKHKFLFSSDYASTLNRSQRVLELLKIAEGTTYYAAQGAFDYMSQDGLFPVTGIEVVFQHYKQVPYSQNHSNEFVPYLSVLDALCNLGVESTADLIIKGVQLPLTLARNASPTFFTIKYIFPSKNRFFMESPPPTSIGTSVFFGSNYKIAQLVDKYSILDKIVCERRSYNPDIYNYSKLYDRELILVEKLADLVFLRNSHFDVGISCGSGLIFKKRHIQLFDKGIWNLHYGPLPEVRGRHPISWGFLKNLGIWCNYSPDRRSNR